MDVSTLAIALNYTNKQINKIKTEGFKIQVETNRSILNGTGEEKVLYFIPKTTSKPQDGYDEVIYVNNSWEQVGSTDIDLSTYATKDWTLEQISKINKINIADAVVTLEANSFVYDGTPKVPTVQSVVLNGTQLTHGVDYAVVVNPATNAGSYVLSVDGVGDHTGVVAVNWGITKAQATISGDDSISIVGLNDAITATYTTNGDGQFEFIVTPSELEVGVSSGGTVELSGKSYGTHNMTVRTQEGQNYLSASKIVSVEVKEPITADVFGVMWDYSLSSPQLSRLTSQNDPYGFVTVAPGQEPTSCVGTTGGQSDFDNYMPWAGMQRFNYVNGQIVDFVDYTNGETYVYIPEFWSKIVDDSANQKMYFYISVSELNGFTLHPGSGRYVGRYECNSNFLSAPGTMPKVNTNLGGFRTGITAIDNKHYQYDIHTYNALELLYIVEFANLNTQATIGAGIISGVVPLTIGETDILTYHTGRVNGAADNVSAVQYRWIENLWGNVWNWVDGILIQDGLVYICNDRANYASSITNDYESTGLYTPTGEGWYKTSQDYNNCYLIPLTTGSSDSTYTCDYYNYDSGVRGLRVGSSYGSSSYAGLFYWYGNNAPGATHASIGGRTVLILNNGGNS